MSLSDKHMQPLHERIQAWSDGWRAATLENGSEKALGFSPYPSRAQLMAAGRAMIQADPEMKDLRYQVVERNLETFVQDIDNRNHDHQPLTT
jgi:hypothetical protein